MSYHSHISVDYFSGDLYEDSNSTDTLVRSGDLSVRQESVSIPMDDGISTEMPTL